MSRTVYLHIGAPKTGTTYLQDRLSRNAATLGAHDVHVPTKSPLVSPGLFHFRAALDLLGQDWGGEPGHAVGSWDALVKKVKRRSGTVVISHEILAPAQSHHVARAMNDLADAEVHVVYTARDLARQLPAAWQESIKQGRKWRYARFLRKSQRGRTWFARAFDLPKVLGTWGAHVPPEHIHLVTVPPRGGPESLWDRFCRATGIDPGWAPAESTRANESLGVAETAVLRQLNKRLDRETRRESAYDGLIRQMLAEEELVRGGLAADHAAADRLRLGRGAEPPVAGVDRAGRGRRRRRRRRPDPDAAGRRRGLARPGPRPAPQAARGRDGGAGRDDLRGGVAARPRAAARRAVPEERRAVALAVTGR